MADKKISALTGATTPLAGTEVLPIVQSGSTVKVSVANLTAGRAIDATSVNKVAITAPATGATLTIAEGKTLTASNSLTLAGTDATTMTFPTTSATVARTDAANSFTGNQTLDTGNLIIGTSGKGIDFSATPGTGTSELLNDYEEGTWTPADASGAGLTFTLEYATYTKVGRLVTLNLRLVFPTTVDASDVLIAGLPFAAAAAGSGSRIASMPTFVSGKTTPSTGQIVSDTQFRLYDYTLNRYTNVGLTGANVFVLFSYIV